MLNSLLIRKHFDRGNLLTQKISKMLNHIKIKSKLHAIYDPSLSINEGITNNNKYDTFSVFNTK